MPGNHFGRARWESMPGQRLRTVLCQFSTMCARDSRTEHSVEGILKPCKGSPIATSTRTYT
eukprot:363121-Chlamydomonas_euryale.AAC.2